MNSDSELMETAKGIIEKRGRGAVEKAREEILGLQHNGEVVSSALKYLTTVTLPRALPVFPALISLSCEAVGGQTEKTTSIGAALTLIAAAADVHDDIIDQSTTKYSKKTVVGKFGVDIALLTGDALLFQGSMLLQKECESLLKEQREAIMSFISKAFYGISNAEAREARLRKKDVTPQEYFELIRLKAVVPEMHCKIGGVLGNAKEETIAILGQYGRTFGIASTIRDEFIDLMEYEELQNRLRNECPPLPMLYALQNPETANQIRPIFENSNLTKKDATKMMKLTLGSMGAQELKKDLYCMVKDEVRNITFLTRKRIAKELAILLEATTIEL